MANPDEVGVAEDSLVFEIERDGSINMFYPDGVDPKTAHPVWTIVAYLLSEKMKDNTWVGQIQLEMAQWKPGPDASSQMH